MSSTMVMLYGLLGVLIYLVMHSAAGRVTVFPGEVKVSSGSNFTAYCTVNDPDRTSADLVWSRGYPPFFLAPDVPLPLPPHVKDVLNGTTVSLTFFNMQRDMDNYYHCYLDDEETYTNAGVCHIMVIDTAQPVEDLFCGAFNPYSFYCYWKEADSRNHETYNATYRNYRPPHETAVMDKCWSGKETPGWPGEGYQRRCVESVHLLTVDVNVEHSNDLGSANAGLTFSLSTDVKPKPIKNLNVTGIRARSFRVIGGPPPEWVRPGIESDKDRVSYEIEYASDDSGWISVEFEKSPIDTSIRGLSPNTNYRVRVRSRYPPNWSDWSEVKAAKTGEAAPSGKVQHLRVQEHPSSRDKTLRSLELDWKDLDKSDKGSDTFTYYVEVIDQRTLRVAEVESTPGTVMFLKDVDKYRAYTIRVTPRNSVGNGTATESSVLDLSTTPSEPSQFKWEAFNETAGTLSWGHPDEPNAIITKFIVKWRRQSEHEYETVEVTSEEGITFYTLPLTGLPAKEGFHFTVCAVSLKSDSCGEIASIEGYTQGAITVPIVYIIVPIVVIILFLLLVCLVRYHRKVKKSIPEPYFVDAVKGNIYGQSTWNYEDQLFIREKETFDLLRTADDSTTQLLGLDRMCSTEGSTSSSDQGIHDMDSHMTNSCSRLVPTDQSKGGTLRVVCENFDKDCNDAVFPDDPCGGQSDPVKGAAGGVASTPPNTPASCHSTEEEDKLGAVGGAPPDYAKFVDPKQLSPGRGGGKMAPCISGHDAASMGENRPLSSASEDSMNYMRVGEGELTPPGPKPVSQNLREADGSPGTQEMDGEIDGAPASPEKQPGKRHPSSSDEDLSGYCKQDMLLGGVPSIATGGVTSSGVSSMGEDYSRIADAPGDSSLGNNPDTPSPWESAQPVAASPPPPVDPYVTVDNLPQAPQQQISPSPAPATTSPFTSPYVTADQAV